MEPCHRMEPHKLARNILLRAPISRAEMTMTPGVITGQHRVQGTDGCLLIGLVSFLSTNIKYLGIMC